MPTTSFSYITVLVLVVQLSISSLLIITLIKRYKETKVVAILLLMVTSILAVLTQLLELFLSLINFENILTNYTSISMHVFSFLGIVTAGIFLIFIDHFENETISPIKLSLSCSAAIGYFITLLVLLTLDVDYLNNVDVNTLFDFVITDTFFILPLFLLYTIISTLRSIQQIKKYAIDENQVKLLNNIIIAIIFYYGITTILGFINGMFFTIGVNFNLDLILNVILPRLSVSIGSFLLWRTYYSTSSVAFLQPQRMDKIIVISKEGLPLFDYSFRQRKEDTDSVLLSGGLLAISSLLKEAVGTVSEIKSVRFSNKIIMIEAEEHFGVFLIVDRTSNFLSSALVSFTKDFAEKYESLLPVEGLFDTSKFEDAKDLVLKKFGLV